MYSVPFHRRIMLLVFVVMFIVLAPSVIFYTAGYRWNAKKGVIERNGTLIIDTQPTGALISLNGKVTSDKSPVTLQNVTPGTYQIHLEKPGYSSWQKTLEVKAERVTFVNGVWLWKQAAPSLVTEGDVQALLTSPNARVIAYVHTEATSTLLSFFDIAAGTKHDVAFPSTYDTAAVVGRLHLVWNDASSAVFVHDEARHGWVVGRTGFASAVKLPDGEYRWDGGTLVGVTPGQRFEYTVSSGVTAQTSLPGGVVDQTDLFRLTTATGSDRLFVAGLTQSGTRFELPAGAWRFADALNGLLFLTDGSELLEFDPDVGQPEATIVPADDLPLVLKTERGTSLLTAHVGELWLTDLGTRPVLLRRNSESLKGAAWHRSGDYVFYATDHEVVALGLDERDGRAETALASFDHIEGLTVSKKLLYIAGTKDGKSGIWALAVE